MGRLGHIGPSAPLRRQLFPAGFGAEVMSLLYDAWKVFAPKHTLRLEERISAVFHKTVIQAYAAAGREWFVTLEDPLVDPNHGTETGRNDMNFYPPLHRGQTIFFTVECKRLHVSRPPTAGAIAKAHSAGKQLPALIFDSLAGEYVEEGMQRFVDEQYSRGLPCGGMVAYVLDNNLDKAFERVRRAIAKRRTVLKMATRAVIKVPSEALPLCRHSGDTLHQRGDGTFKLHHLLLGVTW